MIQLPAQRDTAQPSETSPAVRACALALLERRALQRQTRGVSTTGGRHRAPSRKPPPTHEWNVCLRLRLFAWKSSQLRATATGMKRLVFGALLLAACSKPAPDSYWFADDESLPRRQFQVVVGETVSDDPRVVKLPGGKTVKEGDTIVYRYPTACGPRDIPMKVVTSPPEMRRALDELTGLDLVLIDTAGRSPRDELKIQELKSLLNEADVDEVHLVLSLTSSLRSLTTTAERFEGANPTSVILTKLDEAPSMGSLLPLARQLPVPVSYLTTGQNVPDDIESADAARMARLILGHEQLSI